MKSDTHKKEVSNGFSRSVLHILNSISTFLKLQYLAKDLSIANFLGAINIYPFLFSEVSIVTKATGKTMSKLNKVMS